MLTIRFSQRVLPVAYGLLPEAVPATVSGPGCLNVREMPRTTDVREPLACLAEGTAVTLTGESAVDALGGEWLFVVAGEVSGWASAGFIDPG